MAQVLPIQRQQQTENSSEYKILPLAQLADILQQKRKAKQKIVHAHGVFDVLHVGHIRHLTEAKSHGDILVVTITADQFVNKGPGRPFFNEHLRAEMLANLALVDFVAINHAPTAIPVLAAVKPDIYIKGPDYKVMETDITGKINDEKTEVEHHGGKIIFTEDITYSSSALLNRFFDIYPDKLKHYLQQKQGSDFSEQVMHYMNKMRDMHVVLVGDTIIDEYMYVAPHERSEKEFMIPTRYLSNEVFAGGVIAAANHVANFCREVTVISVIGEQNSHEDLIRNSVADNVKLKLITRGQAPTTRKVRMVDPNNNRKLFEVCYMDDSPLPDDLARRLQEIIKDQVSRADVTISVDFGHGMIYGETVDVIQEHARFLAINTQSNSANRGFNLIHKYQRADYVCIDHSEARLAIADKYVDLEHMVCTRLPQMLDCPKFIVTCGKNGCATFAPQEGMANIPAFAETAIDTMGAGDAFLAVTSPLAATGAPMEVVGFVGNAVGAAKVGIVGHRKAVDKVAIMKYITAMLK